MSAQLYIKEALLVKDSGRSSTRERTGDIDMCQFFIMDCVQAWDVTVEYVSPARSVEITLQGSQFVRLWDYNFCIHDFSPISSTTPLAHKEHLEKGRPFTNNLWFCVTAKCQCHKVKNSICHQKGQ